MWKNIKEIKEKRLPKEVREYLIWGLRDLLKMQGREHVYGNQVYNSDLLLMAAVTRETRGYVKLAKAILKIKGDKNE